MATQRWTDDEVWETLRGILCGVLGVKPEEVTKDARMIEDLGMNQYIDAHAHWYVIDREGTVGGKEMLPQHYMYRREGK